MVPSAASSQPHDVVTAVLDAARRVLEADGVALWRCDLDQWHVRASAGVPDAVLLDPVEIESPDPLVVEDTASARVPREAIARHEAAGIRALATIPLWHGGERRGAIVAYYRSPRRFDGTELETACAIGRAVAAGLAAADLNEQHRGDREWSLFLDRASTALAASLDLHTTAQTVADLAVPFFADSCAIHVPGPDGEVRLAAASHVDASRREAMLLLAGRRQPNRRRGWGRTIVEGTVELFEEIDERTIAESLGGDPELTHAFDQLRFVSQLSVPLHAHGRLVGAITFALAPGPRRYRTADIARAQELARRCAMAIDNARLYEEAQRREVDAARAEQRATFLAEAGAALASSLDYDETLRTVVQLAVPSVADWCALDMAMPDGRIERLATMHVDPAKIPLAQTILERYEDRTSPYGIHHVVRTAQPVMMAHITDEMIVAAAKGDTERIALVRALGLASYICVPLVVQGQALGALTFVSAESGRHFTDADLRLAQDVAYRAALAVESARVYAEARRANHLKDEFLATLSHELRTPLNAIMGYSRMLRDGTIGADRRERALEVVERNATMLSQIVADILDVSRITAGKLRLEARPVSLEPIVNDAVAAMLPAAEAKGVAVHTCFEPHARTIWADADRLQQVMWNLVSNAVKFTPQGGRVTIEVGHAHGQATIAVSDTGIGIAPEFLPHVFEPFRQGDPRFTREHGGLGLGLAIAKHLVEMHGGTIHVASDGLGKGATFRVHLPQGARAAAAGDVMR